MSDIVNKHELTENFNNIFKKSIFGLDNINQFGKLEQIDDRFYNSDEDKYVLEYTPLHHQQYLTLKKNEYPILLYNDVVNGYGTLFYITNIIDGLILDNDEILFLILFAIKIQTFPQPDKLAGPHYMPLRPFIKYLVDHNFIDSEISRGGKLDKSLKRYFDYINNNKIKADKYDNLLEKYNELKDEKNNFNQILDLNKEIYNIQEEKNKLLEKIIELEKDKNKLLKKYNDVNEEKYVIQLENIKLKSLCDNL
jgi:hypothetical protein